MDKFRAIRPLSMGTLLATTLILHSCIQAPVKEKVSLEESTCLKITIPASCLGNDRCYYDAEKKKCLDAKPNEVNTCAAIKDKNFCKKHRQSIDNKPCDWDKNKEPPCVVKTITQPNEETKAVEPTVIPKNHYAYFELTFADNEFAQGMAVAAIGRNQEGSRLYFSTYTRPGYISSLDIVNNSIKEKKIAPEGSFKVRKEEVQTSLGFVDSEVQVPVVADNAFVTHIVAGPAKNALLAIENNADKSGAIVRIDDETPVNAWPTEAKISSLGIVQNNWVAFLKQASLGMHAPIDDPPQSEALEGPKTKITDIITAVGTGNDPQEAYFANAQNEVVSRQVQLGGTLNFANPLARREDLQFDPEDPDAPNSGIKTLAVLQDYLLIGIYGPAGLADTGGVAIVNLKTSDKKKPSLEQKGWNVLNIDVCDDKQKAIIATTEGLMFFYNGQLSLINDQTWKNFKADGVSPQNPLVISNKSLKLDLHDVTGAVCIKDAFYIATLAGIHKVDIKVKFKAQAP